MAVSVFGDKAIMPDDGMVSAALGAASSIWDELRSRMQDSYPNVTGEWKHYGKLSGWSYKLVSGKRNLLFFIPKADGFRIRVVLGENAASIAEADGTLPDELKEAIRVAVPYAEGRSIDIDIASRDQLEAVLTLIRAKMT